MVATTDAGTDTKDADILAWLADHETAMLDLLQRLVNIDSGSYDKAGVDRVAKVIRAFFEEQSPADSDGITCDIIPVEKHGDALRATLPGGDGGNRPVLLMGHRDTVFGKDEASRRPFTIKDGRAYGPGVADMKAGLVMNAFVFAAFAAHGGASMPLVALFTGDEEIGSPTSRPIIEAEARRARAVFNSEPGRASGNIVSGRKGGIFFRVEITGRAAHSGANFADGRSAILELARKIEAWHGLTDLDAGTTVNIGLISGGQSVNSVAPNASCEIDLRYVDPAARSDLIAAITKIAETSSIDGTTGSIEIIGEFLPLHQSPEAADLFDVYTSASLQLDVEVDGEFTGGCADSGFAAAVGTPTLCGVGPVGGKAHSPDEYLEVASMVSRAQAVALSIMRLGAG